MPKTDQKPQRSENGLIAKTATEVVSLLREGRISSHDLLDALEHRIAAVDGAAGALPTLCIHTGARKQADRLSARPVEQRGLLCGLPVPIKDLTSALKRGLARKLG